MTSFFFMQKLYFEKMKNAEIKGYTIINIC